jgi:hypothetical protein
MGFTVWKARKSPSLKIVIYFKRKLPSKCYNCSITKYLRGIFLMILLKWMKGKETIQEKCTNTSFSSNT